jgi:MEDS: MEthanogen/methylotroph, DcmR Sensory domain
MTAGFVHQSCGYESDDEFVAVAVPFVRAGLEAGEPVLATTTTANLDLLGRSLGQDVNRIEVAESAAFGRRPPQRVAAFQRYWRANASPPDGRVRILAEPVWQGWSDQEVRSWIRMESGLNVVLAEANVTMVCPYDTRLVNQDVSSSALRTHPLIAGASGHSDSVDYADPIAFAAECDQAFTPAPAPAAAALLSAGSVAPRSLRQFANDQARLQQLPDDKAGLFVFAVHELATYLSGEFSHPMDVRIWAATDALHGELRVTGCRVPEPYAGFDSPGPSAHDDDRLWIARQLCDILEIRLTDTGVAAWLSFSGADATERPDAAR